MSRLHVLVALLVAGGVPMLAPAQSGPVVREICCGSQGCTVPPAGGSAPVERVRAADEELNRTYAAVLAQYERDPAAVQAIREAQRAWIRLRDLDFAATLRSWKDYADITAPGVEDSLLFADIRAEMNLERSAFLCSNYLADRG
jgi:uncharacterized protein YecT (DUF1311 family)